MSSIDELHWKAILDTSDFDDKVRDLRKKASDLNTDLSKMLNVYSKFKGKTVITDKGVQNAKDLSAILSEIQSKMSALPNSVKVMNAETGKTPQNVQKTNAQLEKTTAHYKNQSKLMRQLASWAGMYFSVHGIRRFLSSMIEITGQFEVQKMALRTILQDVDAADKIFQDLYRFSSDSTYRFSELAKYSKQLAAFNIGKESLLETTKMLGDVASGVGVSMDRLILAYGHVKSSGFLRGIQLRSFSQNGVPVLDELAKMFTELEGRAVSLGEVFDKMTRREISFEMVEQAFKNMTSEGGKFYQMQEVLSKTLAGQINILKGRWENLQYAMGQSQEGFLKGIVSSVSNLIADYENLGKTLSKVIAAYGVYQVTLFGVTAATQGLATATNVGLMGSLKKIIGATNPYVVLAAAIAGVSVAAYSLITALSGVEKVEKSVTDSQRKFTDEITQQNTELELLYYRLNQATEGTNEYATAKKTIQNRYSEYINQLKQEGVEVNNLAGIYDKLKEKISDATRERFLHTASEDLEKVFTESRKEWLDEALGGRNALGIRYKGLLELAFDAAKLGKPTSAQKEAYKSYLSGLIDVPGLKKMAEKMPESDIQSVIDLITGSGKFKGYWVSGRTEFVKKQLDDIGNAYATGLQEITEFYDTAKKVTTTGEVEQMTYKLSDIVQGIKNFDKDIKKLRDKSATKGGITQDEKEQLDQLVSQREAQAKLYEDIMGVKYDQAMKKSESELSKAEQQRINEIKAEIRNLQKLKAIYDELAENTLIGPENAKNIMKEFYNVGDVNFVEKISDLLGDNGLGAFIGKSGVAEYIQSVTTALEKDGTDAIKQLIKAFTKLKEARDKADAEDYNYEGIGKLFEITRVASDAVEKIGKANQKYKKNVELVKALQSIKNDEEREKALKALRAAIGEEAWKRYVEQGEAAFEDLREAEIKSIRATAQKRITEMASAYGKNAIDMDKYINLSHLSRKSLAQLETLRNRVSQAMIGGWKSLEEDENFLPNLTKAGITLEDFKKAYAQYFQDIFNNMNDEGFKRVLNNAKSLVGAFGEIGDLLIDIGDKTDNDVLKSWGKALNVGKEIANVFLSNENIMHDLFDQKNIDEAANTINEISSEVKDIVDSSKDVEKEVGNVADDAKNLASSADWITMIIKVALIAIKEIASAVGEDTASAKQLLDTFREIRFEAAMTKIGERLDADSIFGVNTIRRLSEANKILKESKDAVKSLYVELEPGKFFLPGENDYTIGHGIMMRTQKYSWLHQQFDPVGAEYELKSLTELAEEMNMALFKDGMFNLEFLEAVQKAFGDLQGEEMADWLSDTIAALKAYEEAMKAVDEALKDVVGDIAQSAADEIVEHWIAAGEAALDYADILDDVAKSYSKMLIQSLIMENALDPITEDLKKAFVENRYEDAMKLISGAMEAVAQSAPMYEQILSAFDPYFKSAESENTLGNGIKGITEDTASLLASYLNAIRADVSYIRMLEENGWKDVNAILAAVGVIPTLNDYMAQVAASNADIARTNQELLIEIQSVITSASGRRAIAVDVQ